MTFRGKRIDTRAPRVLHSIIFFHELTPKNLSEGQLAFRTHFQDLATMFTPQTYTTCSANWLGWKLNKRDWSPGGHRRLTMPSHNGSHQELEIRAGEEGVPVRQVSYMTCSIFCRTNLKRGRRKTRETFGTGVLFCTNILKQNKTCLFT